MKVCVAPARTFALDGITLTTTWGGGGGVEVLVIPAQLERIRISIIAGPMSARRIKCFMWFGVNARMRMLMRPRTYINDARQRCRQTTGRRYKLGAGEGDADFSDALVHQSNEVGRPLEGLAPFVVRASAWFSSDHFSQRLTLFLQRRYFVPNFNQHIAK